MASFGNPVYQASSQQHGAAAGQLPTVPVTYVASPPHQQHPQQYAPPQTTAAAPAGTFHPGTKITVGRQRIVIQKYLSEGGFAHVYLVKLERPVAGTDVAVLKRVAVPDKDALRGMKTEVETMKRLRGHRPIVTYFDSHASELRGGGYEVFLLMEYCNGGGLIDFMNTRLQHRLTEPEILHIFTDVAEGVACMHYLKPPLLHRDLKVENVLISTSGAGGSTKRFKLCDFGSAAEPRPAPLTVGECRLMDEDVQRHTTLQYRSPEMVDVYRKQPLDEKSDIWALGVLLYKLCYYTTPFEEHGQLAILNANFRYPSYPVFSDRLKKLIGSMLKESQQARPNIYQVLKEGCLMQGREVPIQDIYPTPYSSSSDLSGKDKLSSASQPRPHSTPVVGAVYAPPAPKKTVIPDVVPMRRGRIPAGSNPASTASPVANPPKLIPSPMKVTSDPFAALDTKSPPPAQSTPPLQQQKQQPLLSTKPQPSSQRPVSRDELSSRFPTLDQFSLLHDSGAKFDFDTPASLPGHQPTISNSSNNIPAKTEKLADEVFATSSSPPKPAGITPGPKPIISGITSRQIVSSPPEVDLTLKKSRSAPVPRPTEISRAQAIITNNPELEAISTTRPSYVSTGTMTITPPTETVSREDPNSVVSRNFQEQTTRAPLNTMHHTNASSASGGRGFLRPEEHVSGGSINKSSSSVSAQLIVPSHTHASSSRPSLEGGRPDLDRGELAPQTSMSRKPRPVSANFEGALGSAWLQQQQQQQPLQQTQFSATPRLSPQLKAQGGSPLLVPVDDENIESNVDFLRSMEESEPKKKDSWASKGSGKRSSIPSLSGTKNILAGKFSDAFKRFEGSSNSNAPQALPPRTPSPLKELERRAMTPILGSQATEDDIYRDGHENALEGEADEMSPEARRELERRRLSDEEKRVAAAQQEYRRRLAERDASSSSTIAAATAEGGGASASSTCANAGFGALPKSIGGVSRAVSIQNRVQNFLAEEQKASSKVQRTAQGYGQYSDAATAASKPEKKLPDIPQKPAAHMINVDAARQAGNGGISPTRPLGSASAPIPTATGPGSGRPPAPRKPYHLNNIPTGTRVATGAGSRLMAPVRDGVAPASEDRDAYLQDFAKRFPSLNTIEMVERDLGGGEGS